MDVLGEVAIYALWVVAAMLGGIGMWALMGLVVDVAADMVPRKRRPKRWCSACGRLLYDNSSLELEETRRRLREAERRLDELREMGGYRG